VAITLYVIIGILTLGKFIHFFFIRLHKI